jgi:hypothetical protein
LCGIICAVQTFNCLAFSFASEEREIGHFDAEGNFVEDKVSKDDKDAWLESAEVVSDKV